MSVFVRIEGLDPEDFSDDEAHDLADRLFADIHDDYPERYEDLTGVIPVLDEDEHARLVEVSAIETPTESDEACVMTDGGVSENRDVLIYIPSFEDIRHKLASNLRDDEIAYWAVRGTPKQTGEGATVLFSNGNRVVATGDIVNVSENRLWFDRLTEADRPNPAEPTTRGFKYV